MPVHPDYGSPRRRPGIVLDAYWEGGDDDLSLKVELATDVEGQTVVISFQCVSTDNPLYQDGGGQSDFHWICLPSRADVNDLHEDCILASMRMASFISGFIPGTAEWSDSMTKGTSPDDPKHFQTALGNVKFNGGFEYVDGTRFDFDVRKASTGPVRTIRSDYSALYNYSFDPGYQGLCIAGAIEKAFPTFVHDYPTDSLSSGDRQDILDLVLGNHATKSFPDLYV